MPVPYSEVPYKQLMCHQGAYDLIDLAGRKNISRWDIKEFEKFSLNACSDLVIRNDREHEALVSCLTALDKGMPFLKYGEKGQHYAYELFLSFPETWGTRGDPFFWTFMARQFTFDALPMGELAFTQKFKSIIKALGVPYGGENCVYIPQFDAGGMSRGMVSGQFVKKAHSILLHRLDKYRLVKHQEK